MSSAIEFMRQMSARDNQYLNTATTNSFGSFKLTLSRLGHYKKPIPFSTHQSDMSTTTNTLTYSYPGVVPKSLGSIQQQTQQQEQQQHVISKCDVWQAEQDKLAAQLLTQPNYMPPYQYPYRVDLKSRYEQHNSRFQTPQRFVHRESQNESMKSLIIGMNLSPSKQLHDSIKEQESSMKSPSSPDIFNSPRDSIKPGAKTTSKHESKKSNLKKNNTSKDGPKKTVKISAASPSKPPKLPTGSKTAPVKTVDQFMKQKKTK